MKRLLFQGEKSPRLIIFVKIPIPTQFFSWLRQDLTVIICGLVLLRGRRTVYAGKRFNQQVGVNLTDVPQKL